jgi:hypothetical protein
VGAGSLDFDFEVLEGIGDDSRNFVLVIGCSVSVTLCDHFRIGTVTNLIPPIRRSETDFAPWSSLDLGYSWACSLT